ncbi:hypothetical protein NE236_17315 [Actinoallomurus purpureus]|uniref:hypothetical protein n=1 Tax=Actinoallomurus purpureus TaxID=478114 RepID=UPI00209397EB|nr:hypothetical protein [Actinoallomurus purpureus]MCO6006747.1 hypothetical protein [Actinoallomurus purpureus]
MPIRLYRAPSAVLAALCAFWPTAATARVGGDPGPIDAQVVDVVTDPRITQASGLAAGENGRILYSHEDSGRSTDVYALGAKGKVQFTVRLPAGSNQDWEDMAAVRLRGGRRAIYLGDIGDALVARKTSHKSGRREFRVLKFAEPATDSTGEVTPTGLETYRLRYADGAVGRNAETLLVQPGTGRVFVVNKTENAQQRASLWEAPSSLNPQGVNLLRNAFPDLPVTRASGGAFSPTGDRVVIRDDDTAYVWWINDNDVAKSLAEKPEEVLLPQQKQGEGVTFTPDGHALLVNSEGSGQPIWRVPLPSSVNAVRTPLPARQSTGGTGNGQDTTLIALAVGGVAVLLAAGLIGYHVRRRS